MAQTWKNIEAAQIERIRQYSESAQLAILRNTVAALAERLDAKEVR